MRHIYYYIKYNIIDPFKNIIRWIPILWKDKDWDHSYIYDILAFKLKNQADYIGKHDRHITAKREAEIMMTCVRLMKKVSDSFYYTEDYPYRKDKIRFEPTDNPNLSKIEFDEISDNLEDYFKIYPRLYKLFSKNEIDKREIAREISICNEKRAKRILFKLLEENINKWWD